MVPVTRVTKEDLQIPREQSFGDRWDQIAAKVDIGSEGLPIGVQVVSYPYQEEVVLRVMQEIQSLLSP